ncbi:Wadjet anti-phage system protein JetD domain-containing protein [Nonomuraea indica]|uniref:Wadjet anti-phage system protein JetD domain-containing protein n=1 Tax=Nonomuraea indica TaxID=1581193 RepID=A0ABW8AAI5_9ACTN
MTWTTPADVLALLRKRWASGTYLGKPWQPVEIGLRGPRAGELGARFGEVQEWVRQWERLDLVRLERARIGGRAIGVNELPRRVWIDTFEQLCALLRVSPEARRFAQLLELTAEQAPDLADWVRSHPMKTLEVAESWPRLLATVAWIETCPPGLYLRQVDVPGVDTKFIERHRAILTDLLDLRVIPDDGVPRADFAGRFGFRKKPAYVRFRLLDGSRLSGFSELTVRTGELTSPPASRVFVIENEITYLAFPPVPRSIAVFGGGYGVAVLERLTWMAEVEVVYWGDIDTHGFVMLDRFRRRYPHVRSMLMDRETLLSHRQHWVTESAQAGDRLDALTSDESELYQELLRDEHGAAVRLEQERIRFSAVRHAAG